MSGLYYLRARYYNPRTGRFTQEDVIYDDGLNLYAYCNSNPVIYCDPSGFAKKNINPCEPKTGESSSNTKHGDKRLYERGFSDEKVNDIVNNYSQKVYQEGGLTVYAKKNGNYYDVIIKNKEGKIVTAVGGNTKSLKTWKDVTKMLNNNGGYSSLPY